jgi:hypothetical protein
MGQNDLDGQPKNPAQEVGVEWKDVVGRHCLFFKFGQYLTEEQAKPAVAKWKFEFDRRPVQKIILVWECLEMEGYDTGARTIWQHTMSEYKSRIDGIYLITKSKIIKAGAHFMGAFAGINISAVTSEEELEKKLFGV